MAYQRFRRVVRRRGVQGFWRALPAELMDVTDAAVETLLRETDADLLVHGHTHRPGVHPHQVDGRERTRIVLGDWYEQGSVLELEALGAPALRTLSFPTPPAYVAESGTTIVRWFCPDCATPVYVQATTRPHFRTVRLGVIDQPHDLAPRMAIWTRMAPKWAVIDPGIDQYEGQPPVPAAPAAGTRTS